MRFWIVIAVMMFFAACGKSEEKVEKETGDFETDETDETGDFDTDETGDFDTDETGDLETEEPVLEITDTVLLETNKGNIKLGLYGNDVPNTAANFLQYVADGFFDGLVFHRVIPEFVIQGGGYNPELEYSETRDPIDFEGNPDVKHVKYALSMARSNDINSATSQFFITLRDLPHLDFETEEDFFDRDKFPCTAFGLVLEGFDVVDTIAKVETGESDVPVEPVVIIKAEIIEGT
jgi:cyclophilin family peptidyl-prolyl cis-trans isomerase